MQVVVLAQVSQWGTGTPELVHTLNMRSWLGFWSIAERRWAQSDI